MILKWERGTSAIILLGKFSFKIKRERVGFALSGSLADFSWGIGLPGPTMALFLSSQGFNKEEFRRLIVIFLTIDFLTFIYFKWIGLITREMLFQNLLLIPAEFLGFVLGNFAFTECNENYFRKQFWRLLSPPGLFF
jgi:hypothetical protein